jgi:hypothetical protein
MKVSSAILLMALAVESPEIRFFHFERPLQGVQSGGQNCVTLDAGIFGHASPGLADLRLYGDGTETPHKIVMSEAAEGGEKVVDPLNLGKRAGQTVFDARMPDGSYSDLQLAVTAQDFIATVTVTGSAAEVGSGGGKETKVGSFTIFDLTRQKLGRSTVLHLPESDFRFLHFRIEGPISPEKITGLSVERLPARPPKFETVAQSGQVVQKDHKSVVEFTVPAGVPVDRIVFVPGASPALFSRDVNVNVEPVVKTPANDGTEPPAAVTGQGNLLRLHSVENGHRIDQERLEMEAPRAEFGAAAKWTISIDNGDDAPIQLKMVELQMRQRSLCFEAGSKTSYTLYYGDPGLTAPRYDYAALFSLQNGAAAAGLGAELANSEYQARPDERPFSERHPLLLWAALGGIVVLLGGIALGSVKRAPKAGS